MKYENIVNELLRDKNIFNDHLSGLTKDEYLWKPVPGKWSLLEIVCHLYDEEREDFRVRIMHVFEGSECPFPAIDPPHWVQERNYIQQNYEEMVNKFVEERQQSVNWLQSLINPKWDNIYNHPEFGKMTAKMFLCNWLAHDYLHLRQILFLKYAYLKYITNENLNYAGNW